MTKRRLLSLSDAEIKHKRYHVVDSSSIKLKLQFTIILGLPLNPIAVPNMAKDLVLSGWTMLTVLELKQELKIATILTGQFITVTMERMFLSAAFLVKIFNNLFILENANSVFCLMNSQTRIQRVAQIQFDLQTTIFWGEEFKIFKICLHFKFHKQFI